MYFCKYRYSLSNNNLQQAFRRKVRKLDQIEITHTIVTLVRTFVYMFIAIRCVRYTLYNKYIQKIKYILPLLHVFTRMWMISSRLWMRPSLVIRSLTAKAKVAIVLDSIQASSDTVESEGRQMQDAAVFIEKYIKQVSK
jgi:hypothetical protein